MFCLLQILKVFHPLNLCILWEVSNSLYSFTSCCTVTCCRGSKLSDSEIPRLLFAVKLLVISHSWPLSFTLLAIHVYSVQNLLSSRLLTKNVKI